MNLTQITHYFSSFSGRALVLRLALLCLLLTAVLAGNSFAQVYFDGTPGTAAPPSTLGPYTMTPFGPDSRNLGSSVNNVPLPAGVSCGGQLGFSTYLDHVRIGQGWATWSHNYKGDVYWTNGSSVTLTLPDGTGAFYFYAEPNNFSTFTIEAITADGTSSGPIPVTGNSGAKYFGFYTTSTSPLSTIKITVENGAQGFAIGEFGIACIPNKFPSDQKAGSVLVYPYYTSSAQLKTDTRVTISNVGKDWVTVHLFFIERGCTQADQFLCLSPNASYAEKASVLDPEFTGYIIAVAVDNMGLPVSANQLIGNAFVNDGDYVGNYGAEAFANLAEAGTRTTTATATSTSAMLLFDGTLPRGYDHIPNQFAVEIQSPNDAVGQRIITVGLTGSITDGTLSGAAQVGIGALYRGDEAFRSFSSFFSGTCQRVGTINATTPRIPNGMAAFLQKGDVGVLRWDIGAGVGLFLTPKTAPNVWSGIRGLHKTRLAPVSRMVIPIFMPGC
jgi:hypothetical protein